MDNFKESVFKQMLQVKRERIAAGHDVFDFSVGSPNVPPAPHIIKTLLESAANPENYVYSLTDLPELRRAAATWYKNRFDVSLDPQTQITSLLGSQEGLSHIALAFADDGDTILVPDPCYPVFSDGPLIAGASPYYMPMRPENDWIIDFRDIPAKAAKDARLMIVSYPNNPTTAIAPPQFYRDLIAFAKEYDIIVLHDNAYSDLVFDGVRVGSFLNYEGATDIGIEFNSLSKTYGIAGARVGFCLGNAEVVDVVKKLKSNMDYGIFLPVQHASITAITGDQTCVTGTCMAYQTRRDAICGGLNSIGWNVGHCPATMFLWAPIPDKYGSSMEFVLDLVEQTGVITTPGEAFGPSGDRFVRIAFVQDVDTINRAVRSIKESGILN